MSIKSTTGTGKHCSTDSIELKEEGHSVAVNPLPVAGVDPVEQKRKMCKSYFLLDKALTGEDKKRTGKDTHKTQANVTNVTSLTDRISLYDMCPRECYAQGCPKKS